MDRSLTFFLVTCCTVLHSIGYANGSPLIFNLTMEGSGFGDSGKPYLRPSPSVVFTSWKQSPEPTLVTIAEEEITTQIERHLLTEVVDFLQENLFLIMVITCLIVGLVFILCLSAFLSRRLKVSSYYPCSFPAKMYVDQMDKTGGGRFFNEVPEKMPRSSSKEREGEKEKEPTSPAKQLQDDIILATRNLRTPTKTPWRYVATTPAETDAEGEGISTVQDENNLQQPLNDKAEREIISRSSQDAMSAGHMEKSDPPGSDLPSESEHPSGEEDTEVQTEPDKQEEVALTMPLVSEEKTAF